jgi:phage-related baseplate assembly protein
MAKILHVFNSIQRLRERYYIASVDKQSLLKLLSEAEVAEQVYNSNAIENSTLTLESAHIMTLAEYAKKNKLSHSNCINKANRQTIEAFLEKGIWKIGEYKQ